MSSGKGKCNPCRNHDCPKCGTTHGMWECVLLEDVYDVRSNNMDKKEKCIVVENENARVFEMEMNEYLNNGYKVASSSCNSRFYKAILILDEE